MTIEHWAEYFYPGSLFTESENKKLKARDVNKALAACLPGAFAFQFYDVCVKVGVLEDGEKIEKRTRRNDSGRYYPGGILKTLEEVEAMGKDYSILASNMRCNNWNPVVLTRRGNYQPFERNDVLLPET